MAAQGHRLVAAALAALATLPAAAQVHRSEEHELGRIRDVRAGPDGYIYLLTDESRAVLARLEPAS